MTSDSSCYKLFLQRPTPILCSIAAFLNSPLLGHACTPTYSSAKRQGHSLRHSPPTLSTHPITSSGGPALHEKRPIRHIHVEQVDLAVHSSNVPLYDCNSVKAPALDMQSADYHITKTYTVRKREFVRSMLYVQTRSMLYVQIRPFPHSVTRANAIR
jgi:hypothetical protein